MELGHHRQFEIHDCLGRGGFGEVYRATMISPGGLRTKVALKLLRTDIDPGGDALSRLRDEGRLLAALRHPAILRAFDIALLDGRIGLVTEYVDGVDLTAVLGVLGARAALAVVEEVAEALDAAYNGGSHDGGEPMRLIHRDIKPSNIRLGKHGEVKLLDFGIARSDEVDREARTGTGSTVGSLSYMAPERFSRAAPGPEADIYALGCTLYEMLSEQRLHLDPVPVEMFRLAAVPEAHAAHVAAALAKLDPGLEVLKPLLSSMLVHAPAKRPTASEVARVAEGLADQVPGPLLKRWAREWQWPPQEPVPGSFDGRTITEGTLSRAEFHLPVEPAGNPSLDTFALDLDAAAEAPTLHDSVVLAVPAAEVEGSGGRQRSLALAGLGLVILVGLLLVGGMVLRDSRGPEAPVVVPVHTYPPAPEAPVQPEAVVPSDPVTPEPPEPPEPPPPSPTTSAVPVAPAPVAPAPVAPLPVVPVAPAPVLPPPQPVVPAPVEIVVPTVAPEPEPVVAMGTLDIDPAGLKVTLVGARATEVTTGKGARRIDLPAGVYELFINGRSGGSTVDVPANGLAFLNCTNSTMSCSRP